MDRETLMTNYAERAVELFKSGANCSQAVFGAFAQEFGMNETMAMKVASGLGGGVGRMREVCGAVTGATLALGMKFGPDKATVYAKVQDLAAAFKRECGSIVCRELLEGTGATSLGAPDARTPEYYRKRPCAEIVRLAARLCAQTFVREDSGAESLISKTIEGLRKRGFEAECAKTRVEAAEKVLTEAESAKSVGWGGSETVKALGLREKLVAAGKEVRDHQLDMDLFLLSANAITTDGRIVNIDGRGNRVAASIAGPRRVIYLIGRNKIVDGGIDAAIARVKRCACPPNCRRLGKQTPCALTGVCADCDSPDRICKVTAIFDRKPTGISAKVYLIDEDLGY